MESFVLRFVILIIARQIKYDKKILKQSVSEK